MSLSSIETGMSMKLNLCPDPREEVERGRSRSRSRRSWMTWGTREMLMLQMPNRRRSRRRR